MSSILAAILAKPQVTFTNSNTGLQVITGVKIKRVSIKLQSIIPRHVREDGTQIVDMRVLRAIMIMVEAFAPTIDDQSQMVALQNDRQNTYIIAAKGLTFNNMMAQGTGIKQSPEVLSAAPLQLIFKELLTQSEGQTENCQQPGDSSTTDLGIQLPTISTQTVTGLVSNVLGNA